MRSNALGTRSMVVLTSPGIWILAIPLLVIGCDQVRALGGDKPSFTVSALPDVEVLAYEVHGGKSRLNYQYRLFGDGHLVREIVDQGTRQPVATSERQLSFQDVQALVGVAAQSGLAECTRDDIRAVVGNRPLSKHPWAVVLRLHFDRYQRRGEAEAAPLEHVVKMDTPSRAAESFPQFREAQGLVLLRTALDEYFGESGSRAVARASTRSTGQLDLEMLPQDQ